MSEIRPQLSRSGDAWNAKIKHYSSGAQLIGPVSAERAGGMRRADVWNAPRVTLNVGPVADGAGPYYGGYGHVIGRECFIRQRKTDTA